MNLSMELSCATCNDTKSLSAVVDPQEFIGDTPLYNNTVRQKGRGMISEAEMWMDLHSHGPAAEEAP